MTGGKSEVSFTCNEKNIKPLATTNHQLLTSSFVVLEIMPPNVLHFIY